MKYEVYEVEFGLRPIASAFCSRWGGGRRMYFIQFLAVQRGVMSSKVSIDECHTYCIARGMSMDDVWGLE